MLGERQWVLAACSRRKCDERCVRIHRFQCYFRTVSYWKLVVRWSAGIVADRVGVCDYVNLPKCSDCDGYCVYLQSDSFDSNSFGLFRHATRISK